MFLNARHMRAALPMLAIAAALLLSGNAAAQPRPNIPAPPNICGVFPQSCAGGTALPTPAEICKRNPLTCHPVRIEHKRYPQCPGCPEYLQMLVDIGTYGNPIDIYDSRGVRVGVLQRMRIPIAQNGRSYRYSFTVPRPSTDATYLLVARRVQSAATPAFSPTVLVKGAQPR